MSAVPLRHGQWSTAPASHAGMSAAAPALNTDLRRGGDDARRARTRWRKLRAATTVLRILLRDRKACGTRTKTAPPLRHNQQSLHLRQQQHTSRQNDARIAARQMELWLADKRELFQRVLCKPCVCILYSGWKGR